MRKAVYLTSAVYMAQVEANLHELNSLVIICTKMLLKPQVFKVFHMFALALTISVILKFYISDLQKVGQCHRVQFSQ